MAKELTPTGSDLLRARRRAAKVTSLLKRAYGSPRLNNKDDPVEELFFIILSQMTTAPSYQRVNERLKRAVGDWNELLLIPPSRLKTLIGDAGLSNQKAPRLLAIAAQLNADFGGVTLEPLRPQSDEEALAYLVSLPAVGIKTAKCVLMYSFGRKVLPVDTHILRIGRRLGLIPEDGPRTQSPDTLEAAVPPQHRYDFHVNGIAHGRAVCRARFPRCKTCVIAEFCDSAFLAEFRNAG